MINVYYSFKDKPYSREILLEVLKNRVGITDAEKKLRVGKNGKPYIFGDEIFFNLSHTNGFTIVAVAPYPVGADVENVNRKIDFSAVAKRWFLPRENENIRSAEDFFALWTKKESAVKFLGGDLIRLLSSIYFTDEIPRGVPALDGAKTMTRRFGDFVFSLTAKDVKDITLLPL